MFKKVLLKSLAGATAVGSALTMSLVAAPAVTSAAPEIRNVACAYPADTTTTTSLSIRKPIAQYGAYNVAVARVTADGTTPTGSVRFVVRDSSGSQVTEVVRPLNANGVASLALPRYLTAQTTYSVAAFYRPTECSEYKTSSNRKNLTVFKRGTAVIPAAPNRVRGQRPVVRVEVATDIARTPVGRISVVVRRNGNLVARGGARLTDGSASMVFRRLPVGRYDVRVRYSGNRNFSSSIGTDTFRVRRR